jgi:hypothetical protein
MGGAVTVSIYERAGSLFIRTMSKAAPGYWIEDGPVTVLRVGDAATDAVGAAVRAAAERSRVGVPAPTDFKVLLEEYRKASGVAPATFMKSARSVSVSWNDGASLTPTKNLGAKKGFEPIEASTIRLPATASDAELGDAVLSAVALCS